MSIRQLLFFFAFGSPYLLFAKSAYEVSFEKATKLFTESKYDQAITEFINTLDLNSQCHQAHFNVGLCYSHQKKHDQAIESFTQAIKIHNEYEKAHVHLGLSYQQKEKLDLAITHLQKACELNPHSSDNLLYLGRALVLHNEFDQAIIRFKRAMELKPQDTTIMLELGNTYNMNNLTQEALNIYYKILKIIPGNGSILYNIAYSLKKLGRIEESLPVYYKVLELDPNHAEAHFSLGLAYLARGDFERGWAEYEWRWKRGHQAPRNLSKPLWDGQDLHGKTLLMHAEQGLGDTFQFIRYAQIMKEKGAHVIAAVQPQLTSILSLCPYIDQVVSLFENLPAHDYQAPLLTFPYVLKTRIDSVPCQIPYLFADAKLEEFWKQKLSHDTNFKVGICWQGNSGYSTHFLRTTVAAKSINLTRLLPLLTLENVTVYNLQKTTGEEQLKNVDTPTNLHSFDENFDKTNGRFMDTAAVIKNLDLMITIDTSMAHISAGLGIPTWVMMNEPADWRWMLERTDTPWYPNMRLFRQPTPGDWDSVIQAIVQELQLVLKDREQLNKRQLSISQQINMVDSLITDLENVLAEKERIGIIDQSYKNLANQMYRNIEQRKSLKNSMAQRK